MSRYTRIDECFGTAQRNQELMIGCALLNMYLRDSYNWIVGFASMDEDLVYVPDKTKLIGSDNVEYELKLIKDDAKKTGEFLAFLTGKEEKFGLEAKISIPLSDAMKLRFDERRNSFIFKVKELGVLPVSAPLQKL